MLLLAIETSCDETAAAVIDDNKLYSNIVYSQLSLHKDFGGVVPELASRAHLQTLIPTIEESLLQANIAKNQIKGIAVTQGPGLIGSLLVGVNAAKAMAYALNIPFAGINHLEGHIFAVQLDYPDLTPPMITLLISGGHTQLILVEDWGKYQVLGKTRDDAVGEAFDKVAKMLTLGYPGGPVIDHWAKTGDPDFYSFPRAMLNKGYHFSLSGLKTAVLNYLESHDKHFIRDHVSDICASFQKAITDVLIQKTLQAANEYKISSVTLAGGVARNHFIRSQFQLHAAKNNVDVYFPSPDYCTDNAAMIGKAGLFHMNLGNKSSYDLDAVSNLKLNVVS